MNNYIDCHSHILYGIDDGSKDLDDSISILKNMQKLGFTEIVLTPHYKNAYHANNQIKRQNAGILQKRIQEENIPIKLYLANEVRISSNILDLIKEDEITLLGNYLFLELPFNTKIFNLERIIYELQSNDINIILVHPERYSYLKNKDYEKLIDQDVMFQINYESIIGIYGMNAKKRVKYLLEHKMVSFIATDVHQDDAKFFAKFVKIKNKIIKIIGEKEFNNIAYNNIRRILYK